MASSQVTLNVFNSDTIPGRGLLQLLEKKKYTDVTFIVEGHQVPAHRCVVASQSDYFDCLLFGSMKEARSDEITLEDTPLEAFRALLKYMYCGLISTLDMETAVELLDLADRYGFERLAKTIENRLCFIINPTNVLQLLFHSEMYNAPLLNRTCLNCADTNAELILTSESILTLPKEHLKYVISRDTFLIDEIQIFWAVQRWKDHNNVSTDEMKDILQCVRLSEIPPEDLQHVVLPSGLYSKETIQLAQRPAPIIITRGRQAVGHNLFEDTCARLKSVQNYTVDMHPTEGKIINYTFKAIVDPSFEETSITVELDEIYLINELKLEGKVSMKYPTKPGKAGAPFSYTINGSRDSEKWIGIVDYNKLTSYSVQQLHFPKLAVKFVRLTLTQGLEGFVLKLLQCSFGFRAEFQFRYQNGGVMAPLSPFTPIYSQHLAPSSNGCYVRCFVTFNQPYSVSMIRFRMKGVTVLPDVGGIQVHLATQNKARHYQMVADLRDHCYDSELYMTFPERAVSIIRITIPLTRKITNPDNAVVLSDAQIKKQKRLLESIHFVIEDLFCQAAQEV